MFVLTVLRYFDTDWHPFLIFIQNVTYLPPCVKRGHGHGGMAPWVTQQTRDRVELATVLITPPFFLTFQPPLAQLTHLSTCNPMKARMPGFDWAEEQSLQQNRETILPSLAMGKPCVNSYWAFLLVDLIQSRSYAAVNAGRGQTSVRAKTDCG